MSSWREGCFVVTMCCTKAAAHYENLVPSTQEQVLGKDLSQVVQSVLCLLGWGSSSSVSLTQICKL